MSWRREHSRTNRFGTTFHVRGHSFAAGENGQGVGYTLQRSNGEAYVNGSLVFKIRCPGCTKPVFFYQNEHGSRVFFEKLGKPWPKHDCPNWQQKFESVPFEIRGWLVQTVSASLQATQRPIKLDEIAQPSGLSRKTKKAIRRTNQIRERIKKDKEAEQRRLIKLDEMRAAWEADGKPIYGRQRINTFKVERRRKLTIKKSERD